MWVGCSSADDLTCISRNDHLFVSVIPFEVVLVFLSMTQLTICFALFQASLNSLSSCNIEQSISFQLRLILQDIFRQLPLSLADVLASLLSKSVDQNVLLTVFLRIEETPKTFLLHRVFSLNDDLL